MISITILAERENQWQKSISKRYYIVSIVWKLRHWYCCCCSVTLSGLLLCDPMDYRTPGLPVHHQLLQPAQTHVHWVRDAIQPSHSLSSLLLLPSIFPSTRVSSNESALHIRWPQYWSFRFSISPSNEHSGLISFRMDWLDLLIVQGTLKSLLQHYSSKASIFQHSALFYIPTLTSIHN